MPWKVVWLPFGEVPGRKQILDWWAVELVQACSFPSTIFHIRMSCYATLILGKNHSRDNLIVCRISGCEDIDLPLQVSGVSLIVWSTWWATSSTRRSQYGSKGLKWFKEDVADTSCTEEEKNVSPLLHHSACLDGYAESESPEVLCRRHCVRWLLAQ